MMKIIDFVKRHKIFVLIISCILLIFVYSHITTYTFTAKVDKLVENTAFMQLDYDEMISFLEDRGYTFDENSIIEEIGERKIWATKGDSYIEFKFSNLYTMFTFYMTDLEITPMFEGVNWGDDMKDIQKKLGLNFLNTRFSSLLGFLSTHVSISDDMIYTSLPNNRKNTIIMGATEDNSNKLNKIIITTYH